MSTHLSEDNLAKHKQPLRVARYQYDYSNSTFNLYRLAWTQLLDWLHALFFSAFKRRISTPIWKVFDAHSYVILFHAKQRLRNVTLAVVIRN